MTAMGLKNGISKKVRDIAKNILGDYFRNLYKDIWMEVSEGAKNFILKVGGDKFIVPNVYAKELLQKDIRLCDDGYSYKRVVNGVEKTKIIIGTPKSFKR